MSSHSCRRPPAYRLGEPDRPLPILTSPVTRRCIAEPSNSRRCAAAAPEDAAADVPPDQNRSPRTPVRTFGDSGPRCLQLVRPRCAGWIARAQQDSSNGSQSEHPFCHHCKSALSRGWICAEGYSRPRSTRRRPIDRKEVLLTNLCSRLVVTSTRRVPTLERADCAAMPAVIRRTRPAREHRRRSTIPDDVG